MSYPIKLKFLFTAVNKVIIMDSYDKKIKPNSRSTRLRTKKFDKSKKNFDKTGGLTKKYIRLMENKKANSLPKY